VGIEKIAEIDEIAKIVKGSAKLNRAELKEMERIRKELGTSFCHRCDYCQPCTAEITISTVMTAKSSFKRTPKARFFGGMGKGVEKAANCTECGKCEERCPYHLPIRQMLSEQLAWYQQEKKKYEEECQTASS
jgi:predicted aldo/keto reductase-like oxidoreductase